MNQKPVQLHQPPKPYQAPGAPARVVSIETYDKPVMLQTVFLTKPITVKVPNGSSYSTEAKTFLREADGWSLELHLRQRVLRVWRTLGGEVVTALLGGGESWTVAGDAVSGEAPKGAA